MKKCNVCGTQMDDIANYCTNCRSSDLSRIIEDTPTENQPIFETPDEIQPNFEAQAETQPDSEVTDIPQPNVFAGTEMEGGIPEMQVPVMEKDNGNIGKGILGAALFSLGGALIYFILFQLNIIAAASAIATFFLAKLGYDIFAKTKNKISNVRTICTIVLTVVVMVATQYFCYGYTVYGILEGDATLSEAFELLPMLFEEAPEIASEFWGDLAFCLGFAALWLVIDIIGEKKKQKKAQNAQNN